MSACESSEIQRQFAGIVQGLGQSMRSSNRSTSSPPMGYSLPPSPSTGPAPTVFPNPTANPMALSAVQPRSSSTPPLQPGRPISMNFASGSSFSAARQGSPRAMLVETDSRSASPLRVRVGGAPVATMSPTAMQAPQRAPQHSAAHRPSVVGQLDFSFQPPQGAPVPGPFIPDQLREVPVIQQYGSVGPAAPVYAPFKGASMSVYGKSLDVMTMFPAMFTAFCFATFITPIILSYQIGRDAQVVFWIGDYISWVIYLPVLYVCAYAYHTIYRLPSKMVMVLCLIGSCVMLLILSDRVLLAAYDRANEFAARDCDTFPTKRELQREWEMARTFYANCVASAAEDNGMTYEAAYSSYRIRDCPEYETQLVEHPHWEYLGQLEEQQQCSGWCERAQPLWVSGDVRDSCSAVVGDIMMNKVQWTMMQVLVYTILVLGIVSVLLVAVGPQLWRYTAAQKALMAAARA